MNLRKLLPLIFILTGATVVTSIGFGAYVVDGNSKSEVLVPLQQITFNNYSQNIVKFLPNEVVKLSYNNSSVEDNKVIMNDVLTLPFSFDANRYGICDIEEADVITYGGLKLDIRLGNQEVYNKAKDEMFIARDFLTLRSQRTLSLDKYINYTYKISGANYDCFTFNDSLKTITMHLPYALEGGSEIDIMSLNDSNAIWKFYLDLDFNLVDEELGYSKDFKLANFFDGTNSLVNIDIETEQYR